MEEDMIEITRNLYFHSPEGYLRYAERSPAKEECDHQICNCTKSVAKKPAGEPSQKQQYIEFIEKDKDYTYEVGLAGTGCNFTLRWPGEVWDKDHKWCSKNHAYYWFNDNKMIQIEIIKEGYGGTDCFFSHLYLGNEVDTSRFYNGHSKSKIVDLSKIKPKELWTHYCGMGQEAMRSLSEEVGETAEWRAVYGLQERIAATARTYSEDFVSSVEKVREGVEANAKMLDDVQTLCKWFSWVTRKLDTTEMFRCGDYCYQNSWDKN